MGYNGCYNKPEYLKKQRERKLGKKNPNYKSGNFCDILSRTEGYIKKGWNSKSIGKRFIKGQTSMDKNFKWNGGINYTYGYIGIKKLNHPFCNIKGYIMEHRLVMEKHIGRYLTKKEQIHHIDFNRSNNNINNLHLFTNNSEHQKYHYFLRKCVKMALNMEVK